METNKGSHNLYTSNKLGQRTAVAQSGAYFAASSTVGWDYNPSGELVEADHSTAANERAYEYDGLGNRVETVDGLIADLTGTANYAADAEKGSGQSF